MESSKNVDNDWNLKNIYCEERSSKSIKLVYVDLLNGYLNHFDSFLGDYCSSSRPISELTINSKKEWFVKAEWTESRDENNCDNSIVLEQRKLAEGSKFSSRNNSFFFEAKVNGSYSYIKDSKFSNNHWLSLFKDKKLALTCKVNVPFSKDMIRFKRVDLSTSLT